MNRGVQWLVVLFLGVITVLLTILVAQNGTSESKAYAGDGTTMGNERFLLGTGLVSTGESACWILDTKNETLSVYRFRAGQALEYLGTRNIRHEVQIKTSLNDKTKNEWQVKELKKQLDKEKPDDEPGDGG